MAAHGPAVLIGQHRSATGCQNGGAAGQQEVENTLFFPPEIAFSFFSENLIDRLAGIGNDFSIKVDERKTA